MRQTPYDRGSLRKPEQFIYKLNRDNRNREYREYSVATYNKDRKEVIIQGIQPDGTFGLKKYQVNGDLLTLITTVL